MRVLQGLDVVTEEQALSSRVAQWLKRLFVLLRYTSTSYSPQEDDDLDEQGIDLESTMRFVKEVILGPSLNSPAPIRPTERERLDGQGLTVDVLAADEEKELAHRFHELYTINSLNRKVRGRLGSLSVLGGGLRPYSYWGGGPRRLSLRTERGPRFHPDPPNPNDHRCGSTTSGGA